jgi:hypothetical protein
MIRRQTRSRKGVAAVEVAVIATFLLVPLMIGIWEVGRMIQVQQIVANSAREGARLAAQGFTVNSVGSPTQVMVNSGTPNVTSVVYGYLLAAGLTNLQQTDVTVTVQFLTPKSDGTTPTEPYQAEKGEVFSVTVSIPWDNVKWVNLGIIRPTTITFTVVWRMMTDDPFVVNTTLPAW